MKDPLEYIGTMGAELAMPKVVIDDGAQEPEAVETQSLDSTDYDNLTGAAAKIGRAGVTSILVKEDETRCKEEKRNVYRDQFEAAVEVYPNVSDFDTAIEQAANAIIKAMGKDPRDRKVSTSTWASNISVLRNAIISGIDLTDEELYNGQGVIPKSKLEAMLREKNKAEDITTNSGETQTEANLGYDDYRLAIDTIVSWLRATTTLDRDAQWAVNEINGVMKQRGSDKQYVSIEVE